MNYQTLFSIPLVFSAIAGGRTVVAIVRVGMVREPEDGWVDQRELL